MPVIVLEVTEAERDKVKRDATEAGYRYVANYQRSRLGLPPRHRGKYKRTQEQRRAQSERMTKLYHQSQEVEGE